MMIRFAFAAAALAAAIPAHAAVVDDFNRANSATLGANYTIQSGGLSILNNQAVGTSISLSTFNGSASTAAGIDVALRGADSGSYIALTLGYLSGTSYFIKVQDNDGDGTFDRYAFYGGNNDLNGFIGALNGFQTGSIDVSYSGTVAQLIVTANGGTQTFSYDYGYTPGSTDVGFGINRLGVADNLRFNAAATAVPEPATWAMMLCGFGLVGGAIRRSVSETALA
jgi:hypothetical protein